MSLEIAVSIDPVSDNNRGMLRGVVDYLSEQSTYRISKVGAVPYIPLAQLKNWNGAGAICVAETPAQLKQLAELPFPKVSVSLHCQPPAQLPTVHSDNEAIGKLAAQHLREVGLNQFAFVGHLGWQHNIARLAGFRSTLEEMGQDCDVIEVRFTGRRLSQNWTTDVDQKSLIRQLKSLPFPVGIFAAHDEFAHDVIDALHKTGYQVPYDAAVVGVNNYQLICETTNPPLSSISQSSHAIGYTAADLLRGLIEGEKPPNQPMLVPPGQLIARRSSDYSAVDDTMVLQAMNFIRDRCGSPITAEDVVEHVGVSRRTLDKRFMAALGHPAAEEIRLTRIKKARDLLATTEMRVMMVGLSCGYDSPSGFVRAFREATGTTPQQFRQQCKSSRNC
jgi:LacI family transcriptional regulator